MVMVMIVSISEMKHRGLRLHATAAGMLRIDGMSCYTHKAEGSSMEDWGLVIHSLSQGGRG